MKGTILCRQKSFPNVKMKKSLYIYYDIKINVYGITMFYAIQSIRFQFQCILDLFSLYPYMLI